MILDSLDHINDDKDVGGGLRKTFFMGKMHKLLQTCKQVATSSKTVVKLCSHCLFQVLEKVQYKRLATFDKLDVRSDLQGCFNKTDTVMI